MKKTSIALLKYGISFGILTWLFYQAWQADQFEALAATEKKYYWLFIALLGGVGAALVSFYRWFLLVRALNLQFSLRDAVRLGFLSHLLNLMSVGVLGGDALKSVFIAKQLPGRGPEAVASVVFDRAIGLLAMFSMASAAYLIAGVNSEGLVHERTNAAVHLVCRTAVLFTLIGFAGLAILFLAPRKFRKSKLYDRLARLPKVGGLFKRMVNVVLAYRNQYKTVIVAFGLSLLINVLFAATFFSIASGISDEPPSLPSHLVISPIAMVANAVPLPGGLGGLEAAVHYLYRGFSSETAPTENGLLVALGFRIILLFTAGIGLVYYFAGKREINELAVEIQSTS